MLLGLVFPTFHPAAQLQIETVRRLSYEQSDGRVPLRRLQGTTPLFFQSKISCDVDGSPNAYHPLNDDLSLDVIGSAGGRRRDNQNSGPLVELPSPDVVVYQQGHPYIQPSGEFKGFYLSETSYQNPSLPATEPTRYLDARKTQFIVLPSGLVPEAQLGDLAIVYDPYTHRHVSAVFGDIGPSSESGEASLATLQRLGLSTPDGKYSPGQSRDDMFFLVFPHTSDLLAKAEPWPHPQATVDSLAEAEFVKWGGADQVEAILKQDAQGGPVPDTAENTLVYDELAALKTQGLAGPYEWALPERCKCGKDGRLPCAPEMVVALHWAVTAAQTKIEQAERGKASLQSVLTWRPHLVTISSILKRFPIETLDEVGPPANEQIRIFALLTRIDRLNLQ